MAVREESCLSIAYSSSLALPDLLGFSQKWYCYFKHAKLSVIDAPQEFLKVPTGIGEGPHTSAADLEAWPSPGGFNFIPDAHGWRSSILLGFPASNGSSA